MCFVYIVKHGTILGITGGYMTMKYPDGTLDTIPKDIVEGVSIFSNAVITTSFIDHCLREDIKVGFFSKYGSYKGSLISATNSNNARMLKQIALRNDERFCMQFARKIIRAKINNQLVVLKRYSKSCGVDNEQHYISMKSAINKLDFLESTNQIKDMKE